MFLPPTAVSMRSLSDVDLDAQLSDLQLSVGTAARVELVLLEEEHMEKVAEFYQ